MIKETLVVVSKYNEDVSWLRRIIYPYIVYDKSDTPIENSIKRPNLGREAETLLYYIIMNYNELPNKTIFLQGDPRSNPVNFTYDEVISEINKPHDNTLKTILTWEGSMDVNDYWLRSCAILHSMLFEGDGKIKYSSGVQYVIPKDNITNRPYELYKALHMLVVKYGTRSLYIDKSNINDGIDAWTMELIWGSLFDKNIELKKDTIEKLFKLL